jgi:hypothetical protein
LRELSSLDRLGDGTDLVDLEEETVASLLLDSGLDTLGVGDGKIIYGVKTRGKEGRKGLISIEIGKDEK